VRHAAGPASIARAPAPAQVSDALRSALRARAPQLGGAAAAGNTHVAGMFGQAVNAGIHGTDDLARDPMGAPGLAGAVAQLRAALSEALRCELEQLVMSPAGLAAISAELASAAGEPDPGPGRSDVGRVCNHSRESTDEDARAATHSSGR
jgi:hypothetical protein